MSIPHNLMDSLKSVPAPLAWYDGAAGIGFRTAGWAQRVQTGTERVELDRVGDAGHISATSLLGAQVVLPLRTIATDSGVWLELEDEPGTGESAVRALLTRVAELERHAYRDTLTGLWNRRYFDATVVTETSRADRHQHPLSLLVIDVDRFKQVNDTHGHAVGDQVLKAVAAILQKRCRTGDLLMRWGGDEFAVLATFCGWRSAKILAEDLRRIVEQSELAPGVQVTLSIGAGQYLPGEATLTWFQRVDAQLYAAKEGGRNAVRCSDLSPPTPETGVVQLIWRDEYRCGDATIDDQHETLVRLANRVLQVMLPSTRGEPDAAALLSDLDALLEHVVQHFADEEVIIAAAGYPRARQHGLAHAQLVSKAQRLRQDVESGKHRLGELVDFLAREVVVRHMSTADADFFPWLSGQKDGEKR